MCIYKVLNAKQSIFFYHENKDEKFYVVILDVSVYARAKCYEYLSIRKVFVLNTKGYHGIAYPVICLSYAFIVKKCMFFQDK